MNMMLGAGGRALERLAALGAMFLLGAGTAAAQGGDAISIDSLTLNAPAVDEGGRATATLTFTVTAGARDVGADDVTVWFAFDVAGIVDSPDGKAADETDFYGLTRDLNDTWKTVKVAAVAAGAAAQYTATHEFGLRPDDDAEDEKFRLAATVANWAHAGRRTATTEAVHTVRDDEEQRYRLSLSSDAGNTIEEDAADATPVTLNLRPPRTRAATVPDFTVVIDPDRRVYDFRPALPDERGDYIDRRSVAAGTLRALEDGNREDETVTLKLYAGAVSGVPAHELAVTVVDIHKLPPPDAITAVARDKVKDGDEVASVAEGGDPVYLTVTVDRGRDPAAMTPEALRIDLRPADPALAGDYELAPARVTLPAVTAVDGEQSTTAEITLSAKRDQDVGHETLVLNLEVTGLDNGPGTSVGTFSIAIDDTTVKQVAPKPDDVVDAAFAAAVARAAVDGELNPGDSFTVDAAGLFTVTEGYRVLYSASSSGAAVAASTSGTTATFEALKGGEATVTVTATATPIGASAVPQTVANVAQVAYPVTVSVIDLAVTLSGPDDPNLTEGGWATLTATANRPVESRTVIELVQTAGTASPADYEIVEPIAIPAGGTAGTARMRAFEDDLVEPGETLTLEGRSGAALKTNPLTLHLWDAAAPALPAAALLALAVLLGAAGLRRRMLRRLAH